MACSAMADEDEGEMNRQEMSRVRYSENECKYSNGPGPSRSAFPKERELEGEMKSGLGDEDDVVQGSIRLNVGRARFGGVANAATRKEGRSVEFRCRNPLITFFALLTP